MGGALTSNRKLDDQQRSPWPQALQHQRYQRVPLTATGQRSRTSLVRTLRGKLTKLPFEVCVLISQQHPRDQHPQYFLGTALSLSAPQILPLYQKRRPMEVDNFSVKQQLGLADFRGQSYYYNEPSFPLAIQRYPALAMGAMGGVVALLPVSHEGQRRLCVKSALGQDGEQEHLHRQDGEPRSFFFT
jgi:hypothetical protein